jgi:hypothetical protein
MSYQMVPVPRSGKGPTEVIPSHTATVSSPLHILPRPSFYPFLPRRLLEAPEVDAIALGQHMLGGSCPESSNNVSNVLLTQPIPNPPTGCMV